MKFLATPLEGLWLIEPERFADDRGYFARSFCREEFAEHGIETDFPQSNVSFNRLAGTMRGLHYQLPPHEEGKLVRCSRGALFDVAVDLRPGSETLGRWYGAELSAENGKQLFVPKGFAHGFLTLADDTEVTYLMSAAYAPGAGAGYRWDDPTFAISWPRSVSIIAEKDRELEHFDPSAHHALWQSAR